MLAPVSRAQQNTGTGTLRLLTFVLIVVLCLLTRRPPAKLVPVQPPS